MFGLFEILKGRCFDFSLKSKIIRHQNSDFDLYKLYTHGQIEHYQKIQGKDIFSKSQQLVSFVGLKGSRSLFIGVYRVQGVKDSPNHTLPKDYLFQDMKPGEYYYELERDQAFDDLRGRLIIDWGSSMRSWHQWLIDDPAKDREIIEILPEGYVSSFPGYLDFVLDYVEFKKIIDNPEANRDWHQKLEETAGIYLIVDSLTGKQYVGSAYGKEGILGRWKSYAASGHGGNNELIKLLESNPSYSSNFRFSIMCTLSKSLTNKEVIEFESLYKEKLGTKAHGLNLN